MEEMRERLFLYRGFRPSGGMRLESNPIEPADEEGSSGLWLFGYGDHRISTTPLKQATLHRQFAALETDEDIRKFASKWGLLGEAEFVHPDPESGLLRFGEGVEVWRAAIRDVWTLMTIGDMAAKKQASMLRTYIRWHNQGITIEYNIRELNGQLSIHPGLAVFDGRKPEVGQDKTPGLVTHSEGSLIARRGHSDGVFSRWESGETVNPAAYFMSRELNKRLRGTTSIQITPFAKTKWYLVPDSLLGVIWLQFMREVIGEVRITKCLRCGKWIQPDPGKRMTIRRKWCDNTCQRTGNRRIQAGRSPSD